VENTEKLLVSFSRASSALCFSRFPLCCCPLLWHHSSGRPIPFSESRTI